MGVLDVVLEQEVEPVGVAVLGLAQVGRDVLGRIAQGEGAGGGVVLREHLVHLAIDARLRGVGQLGIVEVAFLLQFLIDRHLVLRVHDVEVAVVGLEAHGVLARVVDTVLPGRTFLRRDHNHTGHRARSIYRCSATVLENLETLDVVGVETGNGRGDERVGIARAEIVGADFHDVLHDHTIDHPQGLRRAIDRCGATHADLRR